jgi:hypothetical protein
MARRVRGPPPDFSAFSSEAVIALLGLDPPPASPWADHFRPPSIALNPSKWPRDDWPGLEYLHRALVRLLWERGGKVEAAAAIRRDLVEGRVHAVVVADGGDGEAHPIPPRRWMTARSGAEMLWTGRSGKGLIYVVTAPEPAEQQLSLSDSDALCKLVLHLAGAKSAAQIAKHSTGTEFEVSERTVSRLLKQARDLLAEKRR